MSVFSKPTGDSPNRGDLIVDEIVGCRLTAGHELFLGLIYPAIELQFVIGEKVGNSLR
jgi:hypothetical protein